MKYQDDLVSIITPAYKAANTIEHTVDSVLAQDYKNWEMIIVNDCSPDNTSEVIHNLEKKDRRIKAFDQEKNGGAASAWNRAFKEAQGRYIAFLDVDDLWVPTKLKEQIHFMKKNGYAFTYAMYDWIDEEDKPLGKTIRIPKMMGYKDLLKNTNIGTLTVMIDRNQVGIPEAEPIRISWDFLEWARILKTGVTAHGYRKVLGHYRVLQNSTSRNKKKVIIAVWKIYRDNLKLPFIQRTYYYSCYALNAVKRYYFVKD